MDDTSARLDTGVRPVDSLPQQPPFRFLTDATRGDDRAEGHWEIRGDESFFSGHFPEDPIVPGVLIAESLAQLSSLAIGGCSREGRAPPSPPLLVSVEIRFRSIVRPPALLHLEARLDRVVGSIAEFEVAARDDVRVVAEGRIMLRSAPEFDA